jgi:DNA repair exonuclease SbcCD ATPase subunit
MIYFRNIKWQNFLSTGNSFTQIDFTRNRSTLIVGENGSGKSTILDALSFALYGKPFRKINKPQLINSINQKGLEVVLEFSIGSKHYKVRRGIKPNIFEVYQNGTLINQDAESKDYQEMFEKNILKLNHKSFSQIVILGSASFVPFMQLSAANRREIIEDLLDIQIFSTMNVLLKDKIAGNKSNIVDIDYNLKLTGEKIDMLKKHINILKTNNDELIKQKQIKIKEYESEIEKVSAEIETNTNEQKTLNTSISDQSKVQTKLRTLETLATQLDSKISKLEKEVEFFTDHNDCPTCRQGIEHEHKEDIIKRDNTQINEVREGKAKLAEEYNKLNARLSEIAQILQKISNLNTIISNSNVQISTWNKFIVDLKAEITDLEKDVSSNEDTSEELKGLKDTLKELLHQREQLVKDKQVLDVAAILLKDTGIKTKIIKQYIPIMNKLINKYLASMDFFVNFELNENFEEVIKSRFRDEFSYESFSEGEKMRIDLALLFTWRAIAKLRNSASTNLLIMDEVFDSSLDNAGTDEFLKILQSLTSDTNTFIISHKGDQLFDKFEHVLKFEKHKNFSRMIQ